MGRMNWTTNLKFPVQVGLLSCSKKSAESSTPGDSAEWNLTTMYFPNIWVPVCGRAIKILLGGKGTKLFAEAWKMDF